MWLDKLYRNTANKWANNFDERTHRIGTSLFQISCRSVKPLPIYGNFCDFSKWQPSAILDFTVLVHHRVKFRVDRSKRCGDMTIFRFLKMAAVPVLNFLKFKILNAKLPIRLGGSIYVTAKFLADRQAVAEIWRFFAFFQNGGRSPSWICYTRV